MTRTRTRLATPNTNRDWRLRSQRRGARPGTGAGAGSCSSTSVGGPGGACSGATGCGTNSVPLMPGTSRARRLDDVARPADGVDQLRLDVVDLLAQVTDVQLDDVRLALEVVLPYAVEDLRLRQHHPLVAHQVAQQLELSGGQVDLDAGPGHLVAALVQFEVRDLQHALAPGLRGRTPQDRVHPREKFLDAERLD